MPTYASPMGNGDQSAKLVVAARAEDRLSRCVDRLAAQGRAAPALVVGATHEATSEVVRRASMRTGGGFGWHRTTLDRLAASLALRRMGLREQAPASALAVEAVCARVVDRMARHDGLGRFEAVADMPGLPRALARTLQELRLADADPAGLPDDLRAAFAAFGAELRRNRLADRAAVFRLAISAVRDGEPSPVVGIPAVWVDVPVLARLEAELVGVLCERAPSVLATVVAGDTRSRDAWQQALEVEPDAVAPAGDAPLARLQAHLFSSSPPPGGALGDQVALVSAPGENRECVEIARRIHHEAAAGVPFDHMAVLLHAPGAYRPHVREALRRAGIPAWFARGIRAPDPSGRALLALLTCRAEGLSARGFAEYLSLGELPAADEAGSPPPPADRYVPPDEALMPDALQRAEQLAEQQAEPQREPVEGPVLAGSLRAPRRWEALIVDAAVIGGLGRWERRLDGLEAQLRLDRAAVEVDDPRLVGIDRRIAELARLRAYALPLLRVLDALPDAASWGAWLDALSSLATRALRRPDRVLAVLAELRPMANTGPVGLDEVRLVLGPRLTDLVERPDERRYGRVFVGPIDAARGLAFDVVFVPGLAERVFPQKVTEDPMLLDSERAALPGLVRNEDRAHAQRTALHLAVGAARERVVLSWPRVDLEQARPRVPSFYGLEVMRAAEGKLPGFDELSRRAGRAGDSRLGWPAPREPSEAIDDAEHDLAMLGDVLRREDADAKGTMHYLLGANPHLARALRFRQRRGWLRRFTEADGLVKPRPEGAAAMASHQLGARSFSPTALQHFAACPYRFLLYTVLRLEPREVPEAIEHMDPLSRGSLIHDVQFQLMSALRDEGLLPVTPLNLDMVRDRLDAILDAVAARYHDELAPAIERVWQDDLVSIRADLREWLRRASLDPQWVPWRFELAFGLTRRGDHDPHSTPEPVALDNGLTLRGSIDLVEQSADGGLRATDHKTGRARVREGAVIGGGEALQPVLYALATEKLFPDRPVIAGRLYYCTSRGGYQERVMPLDPQARHIAAEMVRIVGDWLSRGFLPAAPAEGACRWCDYRPVCGPWEEQRTTRVKDRAQVGDLEYLRSLK